MSIKFREIFQPPPFILTSPTIRHERVMLQESEKFDENNFFFISFIACIRRNHSNSYVVFTTSYQLLRWKRFNYRHFIYNLIVDMMSLNNGKISSLVPPRTYRSKL